jgi:long-chain fatty acid transport protein
MLQRYVLAVALLLLTSVPQLCLATNGYFQHGIGVKEQSLGGAAIAYPQSVMSLATNPAAAVAVPRRLDLGIDWFMPQRYANVGDGSGYYRSHETDFFIPQLGYNHPLGDRWSLALVAYANGGMQTDWHESFYGDRDTYSNLAQYVIAPTLACRIGDAHALGLSVNYVRQKFEAKGLQDFAAATPSGTTAYLSDVGEDLSTGWGVRLGYAWQVTPAVKVGAFWQPKIHMSRFDDYRELFPDHGVFDIPATYGAGVAVTPTDKLSVAVDLVQIDYADVPLFGNRNSIGTALLGTDQGSGFGWKDVTVVKVGVAYQWRPDLTVRAGWNHGTSPLRSSETAFNVLSPSTITNHLTLGVTWKLSAHSELSMSYWHGFEHEVKGHFQAANGADAADLKMFQDNVGIAYAYTF